MKCGINSRCGIRSLDLGNMAISSIYQYLRYSYMYVNISSVASVARKDLGFDILDWHVETARDLSGRDRPRAVYSTFSHIKSPDVDES